MPQIYYLFYFGYKSNKKYSIKKDIFKYFFQNDIFFVIYVTISHIYTIKGINKKPSLMPFHIFI